MPAPAGFLRVGVRRNIQQQKESVVHMEPVVITGNSARPETEFYTAKEMFDRGRLAKAFDKYEDCVRFFFGGHFRLHEHPLRGARDIQSRFM